MDGYHLNPIGEPLVHEAEAADDDFADEQRLELWDNASGVREVRETDTGTRRVVYETQSRRR